MRSTAILLSMIAWNLLAASAVSAPPPTQPTQPTQPATRPSDPAARAYSDALNRLGGADAAVVWETVTPDSTGVHLGRFRITPAIAALLARHEQTLELIRRGAREPRCDWSQLRAPPIARALMNAADEEQTTQPAATQAATTRAAAGDAAKDGDEPDPDNPEFNTMMAAGTLPILAALRAQQLFEQEKPGEAAMWLADALAVTRQLTATTDQARFHAGLMFEHAVIAALAQDLLEVPKAQLEQLKTRLASFPAPARFRDIMARDAEQTDRNAKKFRAKVTALDPTTASSQLVKTLEDLTVGPCAVVEAMSVPPDDALEKLEAAETAGRG